MSVDAASGHRRLLVPEVVQISAMDCGPASLKCLLEGYGISVSYGRLREACQTDVDGTSINTMEEVAVQLGLVAEQIMLPVDHLLLPETRALPGRDCGVCGAPSCAALAEDIVMERAQRAFCPYVVCEEEGAT